VASEIKFTDEFGDWWESRSTAEQDSARDGVELLRQYGVSLPFAYSSGVAGSK